MSETDLIIIAKKLAQFLHLQINNSPADPNLILQALQKVIPQAKQYFQQIQKLQSQEDQWNAIINFIEVQILDENQQFGFQKLDTEQLVQIYQVVFELAQSIDQNNQGNQNPLDNQEETSSGPDDNSIRQQKSPGQLYIESLQQQIKKQKQISNSQSPNQLSHNQKKQQNHNQKKPQSKKQKSKKEGSKINAKQNHQKQPSKIIEINHHHNSTIQKNLSNKKVVKKAKNNDTQRPRPITAHNKVKAIKQQIPFEEQIIKTVSQVIRGRSTKNKLKQNTKTSTLLRNAQTLQAMQRAKSKFQNQLKEHQRQLKKKKEVSNKIKKDILNKKNQDYLQFIKRKQKSMEENVVNEQLKYYMKLRQKKISYIKHMHKLMQTLEKQRQINLHKEQTLLQKKLKEKIKMKIEQADHLFQQNMDQLKQEYNKKRTNQNLKNDQELKLCRQMQKGLSQKKMEEIQLMKVLWEQERMKLGVIIDDEEKIKNRIIDMYRKNRP